MSTTMTKPYTVHPGYPICGKCGREARAGHTTFYYPGKEETLCSECSPIKLMSFTATAADFKTEIVFTEI
jgi:hypothetical protein